MFYLCIILNTIMNHTCNHRSSIYIHFIKSQTITLSNIATLILFGYNSIVISLLVSSSRSVMWLWGSEWCIIHSAWPLTPSGDPRRSGCALKRCRPSLEPLMSADCCVTMTTGPGQGQDVLLLLLLDWLHHQWPLTPRRPVSSHPLVAQKRLRCCSSGVQSDDD